MTRAERNGAASIAAARRRAARRRRRMSDAPVFSRKLLIGWIAGAVVVFAVSMYLMGGGEPGGGPDEYRAEHVLALGDRARRPRRGAAAARRVGGQEPLQLAGKARAWKPAGDRRAASEPAVGRVDADLAQGQHDSAGAAEVGRRAERAKSRLAARGPGALARRGPLGARAGGGARRGGARERRAEVDDQHARSRPEPRGAGATGAREEACVRSWPPTKACWWPRSASAIARSGSCRTPTSSPITASAREGNAALAVALIKRLRRPQRQRGVRRDHPRLRRRTRRARSC